MLVFVEDTVTMYQTRSWDTSSWKIFKNRISSKVPSWVSFCFVGMSASFTITRFCLDPREGVVFFGLTLMDLMDCWCFLWFFYRNYCKRYDISKLEDYGFSTSAVFLFLVGDMGVVFLA